MFLVNETMDVAYQDRAKEDQAYRTNKAKELVDTHLDRVGQITWRKDKLSGNPVYTSLNELFASLKGQAPEEQSKENHHGWPIPTMKVATLTDTEGFNYYVVVQSIATVNGGDYTIKANWYPSCEINHPHYAVIIDYCTKSQLAWIRIEA